jgi:hypothetical protein
VTRLIFAPLNFANAPKKSLGMQPTSYVCRGNEKLTRKEQVKLFGFVLPLFGI